MGTPTLYTMMHICIDDKTRERLETVARETGRSIEDLAECAIAEAALDSARSRGDL